MNLGTSIFRWVAPNSQKINHCHPARQTESLPATDPCKSLPASHTNQALPQSVASLRLSSEMAVVGGLGLAAGTTSAILGAGEITSALKVHKESFQQVGNRCHPPIRT